MHLPDTEALEDHLADIQTVFPSDLSEDRRGESCRAVCAPRCEDDHGTDDGIAIDRIRHAGPIEAQQRLIRIWDQRRDRNVDLLAMP